MSRPLFSVVVWWILVGCSANGPDPQPTSVPDMPRAMPKEAPVSGVNKRIRVDLIVDKPMPIPALDASATLLSAERVYHRAPDGSRYETVRGRVLLTRGAQTVEVDFVEGSSFEQFGYQMAIFGDASDLELSVFPPGEAVRP